MPDGDDDQHGAGDREADDRRIERGGRGSEEEQPVADPRGKHREQQADSLTAEQVVGADQHPEDQDRSEEQK